MFQSRLGFSGRLDVLAVIAHLTDHLVSIPSWVFWSSRPIPPDKCVMREFRFNPVLGFLVVSTQRPCEYLTDSNGFNPVLGFLVVSTS